jgi:glycosyltransferase involved in cell wall biosynthesis
MICIDGTSLDNSIRKRGIGIYVEALLQGIERSKIDKGNVSILRYDNKCINSNLINIWKLPIGKIPERALWLTSALILRPYLSLKNTKLFHSTHPYNLPISRRFKTIATIHDLIPSVYRKEYLDISPFDEKLSYLYRLRQYRKVDYIIAISEQTKQDCLEYLKVHDDRITVIHHGIDTNQYQHIQDEESLERTRKIYSLPPKFLLYVGGADYRKNIMRLVNAFGKIANFVEEELIMVGEWYPEWVSTLQNQLQALGIQNKVHFLSFVETQDLACLYTLTTALLFPSLYEGFGLPVLEAFSCRTPVLCSNNSSLKEIANGCAIMVDPYQEDDIAQGILKITQDEKLRQELSVKGYKRSKDFSIEKMTQETLAVYDKVLNCNHSN